MADSRSDASTVAFKRATAAAVRAIAERKDVQISYEGDGTSGGVTLNLPLGKITDFAPFRGQADSQALKLRHHNADLHRRRLPDDVNARVAFEILEQIRCEALGAREMVGVKGNLTAALDRRCKRHGFTRANQKSQVPKAEALRLLAFESLVDELPDSAKPAADLWRDWGDEFRLNVKELARLLDDQEAFARRARRLIHAMHFSPHTDLDGDEDEADPPEQDEGNEAEGRGEPETAEQPVPASQAGASTETADEEVVSSALPDEMGDDDEESAPGRSPHPGVSPAAAPSNKAITTPFDEVVHAPALCDTDELPRLRAKHPQR
ncbi:MAG: cobaltochelatase subunit CobT, partial [Candidatus Competibacterales bacterium]